MNRMKGGPSKGTTATMVEGIDDGSAKREKDEIKTLLNAMKVPQSFALEYEKSPARLAMTESW